MKFLRNTLLFSLLLGFFVAASSSTVFAQSVTCKGFTFTEGNLLGRDNGDIIVRLLNNRIYTSRDGVLSTSSQIYYPMRNSSGFSGLTEYQWFQCVNQRDPSTSGNNFLGQQIGNTIACNGKTIQANTWLSFFLGEDGYRTFNIAKIDNGLLRVHAVRKPPGGYPSTEDLNLSRAANGIAYNMTLLWPGYRDNHPNSSLGFQLSEDEVNGCFWVDDPKYPDGPTNHCSENPVIGNISTITQTGLTFAFTGPKNLKWRVKSGGNTVANGTSTTANNVSLTFGSTLSYGDYTLEIEGGDCTSDVNSKAFTIYSPICTAPPIISSISGITSKGLTVNFTGAISANSVDWMIRNSAGQTVAGFNKTGTSGASSMGITFSFLKNASYTLEVSAADCNSSASSQAFQMDVPKQNCADGPRITSISKINNNGLELLFDGFEVGSIAWRILNSAGTTSLESGEVVPINNHPTLGYNLANGPYKLEIQGGTTCESTPVTQNFTIGPLPIYISSFDGVSKKEGVALSWNVVSEKNGEGFQVLRYDDKVKTPQIIASVPLREEKIGTYNYLDESPANGTNYYQLKQIDTDGSFTTSRIINVSFDGVYGMFMAPNPAREFVDVEFESRINGTASFETYSTAGVKVLNSRQKVKIGQNKIRMNVSTLTEGSYILKMENGEVSKSLRFLKVH